ncbi:MAG: shikimate kinase [Rikenellaceae bacterium]
MRIFIVGFMGSGKSTSGRKIARELHCKFIDLDRYIELEKGASLMDIFRYEGEDIFRGYEREALERICSEYNNVVVATGGGTPCFNDNMSYLNEMGITVYLRHPSGQLASRLSESYNPRPLIKGMTLEELRVYVAEKLSEREVFYNSSTLVVESPSRNISGIVEIIREQINKDIIF